MVKDIEELRLLIASTPYPNVEYVPIEDTSEKKDQFLKDQRKYRTDLYHKVKDHFKEEPDDKKERLEQQRQYRKESYKKYKENKLKRGIQID